MVLIPDWHLLESLVRSEERVLEFEMQFGN